MAADAPRLGVHELRFLDGVEARRLEPQLRCRAAIFSPYTGVIDTHALMLTLLADAQAAGAMIAYETRLDAVRIERGSIIAHTIAEGREYAIAAHILINAAGLGAAAIARSSYRDHHGAAHAARVPEVDLAKGSFFALGGALPFARIIMPLSETLAMGGAFTIDSGGQGKFGPDLEWVDAVDYNVDETRAPRFAAAIRRYYPELEDERLRPDFAGIRPRLRAQGGAQGGAAPDWGVLGPEDHGVAGLFHLLGFETPGVTACLAIAEHVCDLAIARSEHAAGQHH
jgi:L-2-hydroxyglutarate oxidase LhgO